MLPPPVQCSFTLTSAGPGRLQIDGCYEKGEPYLGNPAYYQKTRGLRLSARQRFAPDTQGGLLTYWNWQICIVGQTDSKSALDSKSCVATSYPSYLILSKHWGLALISADVRLGMTPEVSANLERPLPNHKMVWLTYNEQGSGRNTRGWVIDKTLRFVEATATPVANTMCPGFNLQVLEDRVSVLRETGKCDGDAMVIETKLECNRAAKTLQLNDTVATISRALSSPYGCYYNLKVDELYWSPVEPIKVGVTTPLDTYRVSVCHQVSAAPPSRFQRINGCYRDTRAQANGFSTYTNEHALVLLWKSSGGGMWMVEDKTTGAAEVVAYALGLGSLGPALVDPNTWYTQACAGATVMTTCAGWERRAVAVLPPPVQCSFTLTSAGPGRLQIDGCYEKGEPYLGNPAYYQKTRGLRLSARQRFAAGLVPLLTYWNWQICIETDSKLTALDSKSCVATSHPTYLDLRQGMTPEASANLERPLPNQKMVWRTYDMEKRGWVIDKTLRFVEGGMRVAEPRSAVELQPPPRIYLTVCSDDGYAAFDDTHSCRAGAPGLNANLPADAPQFTSCFTGGTPAFNTSVSCLRAASKLNEIFRTAHHMQNGNEAHGALKVSCGGKSGRTIRFANKDTCKYLGLRAINSLTTRTRTATIGCWQRISGEGCGGTLFLVVHLGRTCYVYYGWLGRLRVGRTVGRMHCVECVKV